MTSPAFLLIALGAGFVVLVVAGDLIVRGATGLARRAGVPPLIVGLTVVAFGTSAPELFVGVQAVLTGAPELAIGNIVGSNIANVLLVLGLPALVAPIVGRSFGARRNAVMVLTATLAFMGFIFFWSVPRPEAASPYALDWRHGVFLLSALIAYLVLQGVRARNKRKERQLEELDDLDAMDGIPHAWPHIWVLVALGMAGLPFGAWIIVNSGVRLAETMDVPQEFIGLTLVAFGTSLPELAATFVAAVRRQTEVAIGNVLGSNLFNILGVGGAIALAGHVPVPETMARYDLWIMLAAAILLLLISMTHRAIGRPLGLVFLLAYAGYIIGLAHIEHVF